VRARLWRSRRRAARPGFEYKVAGTGDAELVPDLDADLALQHVGVLVLAFVGVQRRSQDAWSDRMLDESKIAAAPVPLDHEPYAKTAHHHHLALVRRQHYSGVWAPRSGHGRPPPFAPQTPLDGNIVTGRRPVKPRFVRPRRPDRFPFSRGPQVLY
jgi:hypothetical protein